MNASLPAKLCALALLLTALAAGAAGANPAVLVVGDSLSAAYGMPQEAGWVALLRQKLAAEGYPHLVVNASISGDTTRGGRTRLRRALAVHAPDVVIIELGGNDGLRGLSLKEVRANLAAMVGSSQDAGAAVVLTGIRIPPNYGQRYTEKFHAIYEGVAGEYSAALVPHLLEGIALNPELMQADGIHPSAGAQPLILEHIWARLQPLLQARTEAGAGSGQR